MKAVLEFDLPEENQDFTDAINGRNYRSCIWEYDQLLRSEIKYKELPEETRQAYKFCREQLRKILMDDNIYIEQ